MHASTELRRAAAALPEHPNLDRVLTRLNRHRKLWGNRPPIDAARLKVSDVCEIRTFIMSEGSPEQLYEHPGRSFTDARIYARVLRYALTELAQLVRRQVRV